MSRIAIDVVLLPSLIMMDRAIEINKELLKKNEDKIVLHQEKCIPHISLCMGCIYEDKIPALKDLLDEISAEFSPFNLRVSELVSEIIPIGQSVSILVIENQEELQRLHETVMKKLWNYLSYDVNTSMLFNPPEVEEVTLFWIKNYQNHYHDPSLFHPHITVGFGESVQLQMPIDFTASMIVLCQLGNFCTCRKTIISSVIR